MIIIWRRKHGSDDASWGVHRMLRGHLMDVCDLAWTPDGRGLASGSVDNRVIVWDAEQAKELRALTEHTHYVQGVAWEPAGGALLTVSSDRTCRLYVQGGAKSKKGSKGGAAARGREWVCSAVMGKRVLAPEPAEPSAAAGPPKPPPPPAGSAHLFAHDSVPTFCRRPDWSPDGSFVVVPCGQYDEPDAAPKAPRADAKADAARARKHTAYVYARGALDAPCAHLPGAAKPIIAVRCCPRLFKLRSAAAAAEGDGGTPAPASAPAPTPWLPLPYRVVWAVLSLDSIILYDSELRAPLCVVQGSHYAPLTDAAWSKDGRVLVATSQDGYATIIRLTRGELGEPLPDAELPPSMRPAPPREAAERAPAAAARLEAGRREAEPPAVAAPAAAAEPPVAMPKTMVAAPPPPAPVGPAEHPPAHEAPAADGANAKPAQRTTAMAAAPPAAAAPTKKRRIVPVAI